MTAEVPEAIPADYPGGEAQLRKDNAHLKTLGILYYVVAGLLVLSVLGMLAGMAILGLMLKATRQLVENPPTAPMGQLQSEGEFTDEQFLEMQEQMVRDMQQLNETLGVDLGEAPDEAQVRQMLEEVRQAQQAQIARPTGPSPEDLAEFEQFGRTFLIASAIGVMGGFILGLVCALAGRSLHKRELYWPVVGVSGVLCLFAPLGTILGVFAIMTLMRPGVKQQFGVA